MILSPHDLVAPALVAGMKVPSDPSDFKRTRFKHFHVFCVLQLRYLRSLDYADHNAAVIAAVPKNFITTLHVPDFRRLGVQGFDF